MKTRTLIFAGLSLLLLWTLTAAAATAQVSQSSPAAPLPAKHLTRKQAAHLINTANTPEEHRELAQYFRQQAQRKRNKEQYYMEIVATYRLHPPRVDAYRNVPTLDLYGHLTDEARDAASADDRRAFLQDRFAEGLAQSK